MKEWIGKLNMIAVIQMIYLRLIIKGQTNISASFDKSLSKVIAFPRV
jgi:hypothetical protein